MRRFKRGLAGLVFISTLPCGLPLAAPPSANGAGGAAGGAGARAERVRAVGAERVRPVAPSAPAGASGSEPRQAGSAAEEREQGRALLRRGRAAEALVRLERALELFRQQNDHAGEASVRDLLGDLYERQGQFDAALRHYEAAYDIFSRMAAREGRQPEVLSALSTQEGTYNANLMVAKMGQARLRRGDAAGARAAFARMRVVAPEKDKLRAVQGGKSGAEAKVSGLRGLGGRLRGAVSGTPSTSTPTQAAGVVSDAANTIKAPFNAYRETVIYSIYELGMGRVAYHHDQLDAAKKHFQNVVEATVGSLPLVGKLRETRRYRVAARTGLADVAFQQGRYAEALKLYAEAARGAQEDGRLDLMWPAQRGAGWTSWAMAAQETDPARAEKLRQDAVAGYRQALATIESIRQGSLRADEARTTFLATTEDVFDEAATALAELALRAQGTQGAAQGGAQGSAAAPLEGRALEYAAEALSVVEAGRARSLLDLLSETGAEIAEGVPAELLQRRRENQSRQEEIAAALTGVALPGEPPKKSLEELEGELTRLQDEFERIENQIRTASPRYAALTTTRPLSLADIRSQVLDDETALLEYSLAEYGSYLFAVTRGGMALSRLPARSEIENQVVALRQQILPASLRRSLTEMVADAGAQRGLTVTTTGGGSAPATPAAVAEYARTAHALYQIIVAPAAPLVAGKRLLVVADGALNYVPFPALVTAPPAGAADFSTLAYLLKTNETIFAPSASVVAAVRQQRAAAGAPAAGAGGMLLVADPIFDPTDSRAGGRQGGPRTAQQPRQQPGQQPGQQASPQAGAAGAGADASRGLGVESALADLTIESPAAGPASNLPASAQAGRGVLVRLTGTRSEAQQIAKLAAAAGHRADTWLDLDASEANVEGRDLAQYRVVHFATHGLLNTERPQFTGLVLSLVNNREGEDGFLRTDEIFNLRLGTPLVMLSACETGLGKEKRGEGVIGLTRAFMYAGAPTVGVSLWSVADKSTADLMTDFYKNLFAKNGGSPAAAMRAARLNMIAGKKFSAPFYWAPFVLVGDWK
ncbi:MAG TPA: CHAT domain-containing tetratricopeptide repeat protein [Pyrinomonadaceae bacterium]|nr:CHAT domain-containing tetratricopeptide repeat protein [Pyrinomonadaceae bacterium]